MADLIATGYPDEATTVLKSSLSKQGEQELQEALHGTPASAAAS